MYYFIHIKEIIFLLSKGEQILGQSIFERIMNYTRKYFNCKTICINKHQFTKIQSFCNHLFITDLIVNFLRNAVRIGLSHKSHRWPVCSLISVCPKLSQPLLPNQCINYFFLIKSRPHLIHSANTKCLPQNER